VARPGCYNTGRCLMTRSSGTRVRAYGPTPRRASAVGGAFHYAVVDHVADGGSGSVGRGVAGSALAVEGRKRVAGVVRDVRGPVPTRSFVSGGLHARTDSTAAELDGLAPGRRALTASAGLLQQGPVSAGGGVTGVAISWCGVGVDNAGYEWVGLDVLARRPTVRSAIPTRIPRARYCPSMNGYATRTAPRLRIRVSSRCTTART
jgi:hypothetical protein